MFKLFLKYYTQPYEKKNKNNNNKFIHSFIQANLRFHHFMNSKNGESGGGGGEGGAGGGEEWEGKQKL